MDGHVRGIDRAKIRLWWNRLKYPALILILGLGLLLWPTDKKQMDNSVQLVSAKETESRGFSLERFTKELENTLGSINGVGKVKVILTLEDQGRDTYQADHQSTEHGDEREEVWETVFSERGDGAPILVHHSLPVFRGALVVCEGGDRPGVSLGIKEAVSGLTGLGMDRITVLKME